MNNEKTVSENLNFQLLSKGAGYKKYFYLNKQKEMSKIIKKFLISKGPCLLEVIIKQGAMKELLIPKNLIKVKYKFMNS